MLSPGAFILAGPTATCERGSKEYKRAVSGPLYLVWGTVLVRIPRGKDVQTEPERGVGVIQARGWGSVLCRENKTVRREWGENRETGERERWRGAGGRDAEREPEGERAISKQTWTLSGVAGAGLSAFSAASDTAGGVSVLQFPDLHLGPSSKLPWGHLSPAVTVQHADNGWCSGLRREGGD